MHNGNFIFNEILSALDLLEGQTEFLQNNNLQSAGFHLQPKL